MILGGPNSYVYSTKIYIYLTIKKFYRVLPTLFHKNFDICILYLVCVFVYIEWRVREGRKKKTWKLISNQTFIQYLFSALLLILPITTTTTACFSLLLHVQMISTVLGIFLLKIEWTGSIYYCGSLAILLYKGETAWTLIKSIFFFDWFFFYSLNDCSLVYKLNSNQKKSGFSRNFFFVFNSHVQCSLFTVHSFIERNFPNFPQKRWKVF